MAIGYCYEWNDLLAAPRDLYDEATARERHQQGQLYTAILGDLAVPHTLVEVRLEVPWIAVHFLDDQLRRQVMYAFGSVEGGRLFLEQYRRIEFSNDGTKAAAEVVRFNKDGLAEVRQRDASTNMVERSNVTADVSENWEPIPAFGDYRSIARFERSTALS